MKLLDERSDVRRKRRVPTTAELERLIGHVENSGYVRGLVGTDRAMLYRVALTIALRASELASLRPESFFERVDGMHARVEACYSKHRREDVVPVPCELATVLRPWLATKPAGERLWPGYWSGQAAAMLQIDLEAVGIPYKTDDGQFDFHATRHTGITRGLGVMEIADLQKFARHSKIEMTMRYVHTADKQLRERADQLPVLSPPVAGEEKPVYVRAKSGRRRAFQQCDRISGRTVVSECPQPSSDVTSEEHS